MAITEDRTPIDDDPGAGDRAITPDDVEASLRQTSEAVEVAVEEHKTKLAAAGAGALLLLVLATFLFGRRKGKQAGTTVELVRL